MPFFFSSFIFLLDSLANPQKLVYIPPFFSPQELRAFRRAGPKRCATASLLSSSLCRLTPARVRAKGLPKTATHPPPYRSRNAHARGGVSKKRAFSCMDKKMKKAHARGGISRKRARNARATTRKKELFRAWDRRSSQEPPKRPQDPPKTAPRDPKRSQDVPQTLSGLP